MALIPYFRKCLLIMVAVVSAFCTPAMADQITIDLPAVNVTVSKDSDGYAKFSFTDDRIQFISKTGEPAIPYLVVKALLPPRANLTTVHVEIKREAVKSDAVTGQSGEKKFEVKPTPPPSTWDGTKVITLDERPSEDPYARNIPFPYSIVGNISTGTIWEWQIIDIPVALFHYNPVTKELFTLKSNSAVVTFEHQSSGMSQSSIPSPSRNEERLRNLVVNFEEIAREYRQITEKKNASQRNKGYVIITKNSVASGSTQLRKFVEHKKSRGFNVYMETENIWGGGTGNVASENIRNWLKKNYEKLNIEYVLLIGNPNPIAGDVPMKMLYPRKMKMPYPKTHYDSPSDYYYADLTGNWDWDKDGKFGEYPDDFRAGGVDRNYEVVVGRIPYYGNIKELDSILSKTMAYQNETNQNWRKKVLLPMERSDNYTLGYHLGEEIKNRVVIPKGWSYYRIYEQNYGLSPVPEKVPCNKDNVTNAWKNSQFGAIFWWTHGGKQGADDIMDISHADMLDNAYPSFTFQCSCTNSHPETTNNLSYSLLKNGAIATVGATRVSWYSPGQTDFAGNSSNSGMTYEYAKYLIGKMKSAGYALHDMKQALTPGIWWMNFTDFCLYGDPEVSL